MSYTTQRQVRKAFWEDHKDVAGISKRRTVNYGDSKQHNTHTRVAFCDFVDRLRRDEQITEALASRVTL